MKLIMLIFVFGFLTAHASETVKGAKKDYENFKHDMQVQLDTTQKKIYELKAKAGAKSTEAQEKSIQEYEQNRDKLKAQLDEMEKSSKSSWQKAKNRLADSIDKLNKKIQKSLEE